VDEFAIYVTVYGCGYYKITNATQVPISNSHFSFTGSFYANGTFSDGTHCSGQDGLDEFYMSGCGHVTGGPWSYNATWQYASAVQNLRYLPLVLKNYRTWDAYYEENDHWLDAYGPLVSDRTYLAYPNDVEDYYYFVLSATATVNVSVTDFAPTSSNGTVALYGPATGSERGNLIEYYGPPGDSSMPLGPHSLGPGKYYVRVNTAQGYSTTQLYRLTVTY
jgi:hypothetical protein